MRDLMKVELESGGFLSKQETLHGGVSPRHSTGERRKAYLGRGAARGKGMAQSRMLQVNMTTTHGVGERGRDSSGG